MSVSQNPASTPAPIPATTSGTAARQIVDSMRAVVAAIDGEFVEITIPGTSYRLRLVCADAESLRPRLGRRVNGRLEGRALRMHVTAGGGRFIEPAEGMPRIVQGSVQSFERRADGGIVRVLVDIAVPVWVEPMPEQCFDEIALGDLVNFYMQSGARFVPSW